MADKKQITQAAAKVLGYVEKVTSFASSINPLFGIVTSVVSVVRKGLVDDENQELNNDFQQIHAKLEDISERNKQILHQLHTNEVNETYCKYEEYIKHQYNAFNTMVEWVTIDPDNSSQYKEDFKKTYEQDKSDLGLDVIYGGVIGKSKVFGRPVLDVYMESCARDKSIMEARCSKLAHLFQIGLMALMAYTVITEDDEDELKDKWTPRVQEIQVKMQSVLKQCK